MWLIKRIKKKHRFRCIIEPVGEIAKMSEGSRGQSVGDNLVRSYPDLGSSNAGKESADLKDGQLIELGSDIKKA